MNLIKGSKEEISVKCVEIIEEKIKEILEERDYVVLALCGGRSVVSIFELFKKAKIDWKKVHIFMTDERRVSLDDKESNFSLVGNTFIDYLIKNRMISKNNVHPFIYDKNKKDFRLNDYNKELKKFNSFDIVLLSSGEDGHVASLFPNHKSIKDGSSYYILVDDAPKMPKERISASKKLILRSNVVLLLFIDEIKREAFNKFLYENIKVEECPAKLVLDVKESYVFTNLK